MDQSRQSHSVSRILLGLGQGYVAFKLDGSDPNGVFGLEQFTAKSLIESLPYQGSDGLEAALLEEWHKIDAEYLWSTVEVVTKRFKACIRTKGDHFDRYLDRVTHFCCFTSKSSISIVIPCLWSKCQGTILWSLSTISGVNRIVLTEIGWCWPSFSLYFEVIFHIRRPWSSYLAEALLLLKRLQCVDSA